MTVSSKSGAGRGQSASADSTSATSFELVVQAGTVSGEPASAGLPVMSSDNQDTHRMLGTDIEKPG